MGEKDFQVLSNCGKPIKIVEGETIVQKVSRGRWSISKTEKWFYDVGGCAIHVLTFERGVLRKITWYKK